jgi:Predicted metal-sulfur cluster biosynthetic enzyme
MEDGKPVFETNLPPDKAQKVVEILRQVYDPEIPINVYDLGLIRKVWLEDGVLKVVMTLTAVGCPVAGNVAQRWGTPYNPPCPRPKTWRWRWISKSRGTPPK